MDEHGHIELLEPITLSAKTQVLVTIQGDEPTKELRPYGLCEGEFIVPDDFDAPLLESILDDFERTFCKRH